MKAALEKAWAWARAHVGALLAALAAILGAGIWLAYERRAGRSTAAARQIAEARARVAALDERRRMLEQQDGERAAALAALEEQRRAIQRETVALDHDIAAMSDEEVESAFRALYGGHGG